MFPHLLLLVAAVEGMVVLRLLRRLDSGARLYLAMVCAELGVTVWALMNVDEFFGTIAIAFFSLTIALPWVLEGLARAAFARGRLVQVGHYSRLRAFLMPGAGLDRHQPILDGLALLERRGVDAALSHFRELAQHTDDGGELAIIHEQIVAMLFYGQRWDEGIAHYERRFHPGYAALRPTLALGLLRAYGEARQFDHAAGLLRALEDGPIGADPRTAELLGQARVTFLAYAGEPATLEVIVAADRCSDLGLSRATGALYQGIALARAGDSGGAAAALGRVERLAGPRDQRVIEASRTAAQRLADAAVELEPELRGYAGHVASRVEGFLRSTAGARRIGGMPASYAIMIALSVATGMGFALDQGGIGMLRIGALTRAHWDAGGGWRLFTAPWIHADMLGLLFDVYAVWLAGQAVERLLGAARMWLCSLGSAVVGLAVGLAVAPDQFGPLAGSNLIAIGAVTAALWTLRVAQTPQILPRARRNLALTLGLLALANVLAVLPGRWGVGLPIESLAGTMGMSSLLALMPPVLPKILRLAVGASAVALLGAMAFSIVAVARDDIDARLVGSEVMCSQAGIEMEVHASVAPTTAIDAAPFDLPIVGGFVDLLELRGGSGLLQFVAVGPEALSTDGTLPAAPLLMHIVPELERELGVTTAHGLSAELHGHWEAASWRALDLRRNGVVVGRVIERVLDQGTGAVFVIASPPEALEHGPGRVSATLASATPSEGAGKEPACRF